MTDSSTIVAEPRFEALFRAWNVHYRLELVSIDDITVDGGQQVRDLANIADQEQVKQYATQERNGAKFPPIVLRNPHLLIDGNTRLEAARKNGRTEIAAYVLELHSAAMARSIAGALNQMGGRRLTEDEAKLAAQTMMTDLGFTTEQVARHVGYSTTQVGAWRRQGEAKAHAAKLDLMDEIEKIAGTIQGYLSRITQDQPFRDLVTFLADTKVTAAEVSAVVKEVEAAGSEDDAITIVDDARRRWRPAGPNNTVIANKPAGRARMTIPQLLHLNPSDVVDLSDRDRAIRDREAWQQLREHAGRVLQAFDVQGVVEQ